MRSKSLIVAGALVLPAIAVASDSVQMTPGRWVETFTTTSASLGGKAIPVAQLGAPISKALCMSAAEAADAQRFFQSRSGSGGACGDPTGTVGAGRIALAATCTREGTPPVAIEVKGDYGAQAYNAAIRAQNGTGAGQTIVTMTASGRFEGACRGDEDKE